MTKEEIIEECKQRLGFETDYEMYSLCQHEKDFYNAIIKALEQQKPMEKFENAKDHIRKLAGDYKCWDNRLSHEESLELYNILEQQPCCNCIEFKRYAKQMGFEIEKSEEKKSDDCVSREQAIKTISTDIQLNLEGRSGLLKYGDVIKDILKALLDSQEKKLKALPPVTPTHGTCKDCRWLTTDEDGNYYCRQTGCFDSLDFYCADYEKRGSSDGNN